MSHERPVEMYTQIYSHWDAITGNVPSMKQCQTLSPQVRAGQITKSWFSDVSKNALEARGDEK